MSFSKLSSSLVYSSLWTQPDNVRLLFITLLSLCDQHGEVQGSRSGIERIANITTGPNGQNPWHVLMGPDPDSSDRMRNPDNEGRRIEEISGGFKLLNHSYYKGLRDEETRREQNRLAQARFKAKGKHYGKQVSQSKPEKAHTDTDTDISYSSKEEYSGHLDGQCVSILDIYKAYPRHTKKPGALRAIQRALKIIDAPLLLERTKAYAKARKGEDPAYTPHPATWFNAQQFNDDPKEWLDRQPSLKTVPREKIVMIN